MSDSLKSTSVAEPSPAVKTAPRNSAVPSRPDASRPAPPSSSRKRGPVFWLVMLLLLAGAGLWVTHFTYRAITFEETDDAYVNGHIHQVSSRLASTVTEVLVADNETVKAGQVLARLDPLEYQISLQKAQAALRGVQSQQSQARASLAQAQAEATQAKAQATQAEARVQEIAAQLEIAKTNFGRNTRLFQNDARAVAKADVDSTKSAADATSASLEGAKASVEAAHAKAQAEEASVEAAKAQLAAAESTVATQEAAVRDAERELSYTTITAPTDGRIGNKNVEAGNRVQIGQALFALVEPHVWIVANFKETQLRKMHVGQPAEVTIDALDGSTFSGKVDSIAPASGAQFALLPPDNATGNFTKVVQRVSVKIALDPNSVHGLEDRLSPGFSAVISVRVK